MVLKKILEKEKCQAKKKVVAGIARQPRIAGIVGGLGAKTSCGFCLELNMRFREIAGRQPCLLLENVPVTLEIERDILFGKISPDMGELLAASVRRLNFAGADFIVIPCNSVHVFLDGLREISGTPIISIIEETASECESRGLKKVGLLGTSTTIKSCLHQKILLGKGIESIIPGENEQEDVDEIILRILSDTADDEDRGHISEVIGRLIMGGAEAIILGCTDLGLLVNPNTCTIPLIDTLSVLEASTLRELLGEKRYERR